MKLFAQKVLANLSREILAKYKPTIIGITGSVGKTSAKEAIFLVVSKKFRARKSEKNFNNEFGLPLTVIGIQNSPGKNIFLWLGILFKALLLIATNQTYPEILVLEMGVDKPGDMDYLLEIVKPKIGVITTIGISHLEAFENEAQLENEKGKLAKNLPPDGYLIVNADNEAALRQKTKTKAKVLSYATNAIADVKVNITKEDLTENYTTSFLVQTGSQKFENSIAALGATHLSSVACALAVAEALKIEKSLIQKALSGYRPLPGRLNILSGIKQSTIIDDTYNAAPASMLIALNLLERMPSQYKIAALSDMLELGRNSEDEHKKIGNRVTQLKINKLIVVGPKAKFIALGAKQGGMKVSDILEFESSIKAKEALEHLVLPGSLILIKGSQGMRMEKLTLEILSQPMHAKELLCRQYGKWLNS